MEDIVEVRPFSIGPEDPGGSRGAFCPRDYRKARRLNLLLWSVGFAVVTATSAYYFIRTEPVLRAYSPSFDLWFTLLFIGMLFGGFSQVPMQTPEYRVPRVVSVGPEGLRMLYSGLRGSKTVLTPWEKVKGVDRVQTRLSWEPRRYSVTFAPGGTRWYTNSFSVEPEMLDGWFHFLPEKVRATLKGEVGPSASRSSDRDAAHPILLSRGLQRDEDVPGTPLR